MLALTAALLAVVGAVQHFAPSVASVTFDQDPAARAYGLALGIVAWLVFVTSRLKATGSRRLVGRIVALACAVAAAARLAGPEAIAALDGMLPLHGVSGLRTVVCALTAGLASGFVYFTSPARRL